MSITILLRHGPNASFRYKPPGGKASYVKMATLPSMKAAKAYAKNKLRGGPYRYVASSRLRRFDKGLYYVV